MILRLFRLAPVVMTVACGWSGPVSAQSAPAATDPPAAVFAESSYPSATQCGACHDQIYREWASSSHAYASISPMFHKFEQRINDLTQGTIGSFCVRCHQQVGTQRGEPREAPLWQRSRVAREGVTCITCHRVEHQFGRVDGERQIVPGNIHSPVYGTLTGSMFDDVVARKGELKLALDGSERGIKIHAGVLENDQLSKPEFCQSCHQVQINLKIKLEVVWEQYRKSPAAAAGVTCQDCHMGKVPGRADGYATAPVAVINGVEINPRRKHSNHAFYGPGYSIAHPGIFPHNPDAGAWTIRQWLTFDWRAGWGSEAFEERSEDIAALFEAFEEAAAPLGFEAAVALTIIRSQLDARRGSDDASALTKALEVISEQLDDLDGGIENDEAKGAASALSARIAALAKGLSEHRGTGDTAAAIARLQSSARALGARIAAMSGFEAAFESGRKAAEAVGSASDAAARRSAMATLDTAVAGMTRAVAALDPDFAASYAALKKSYGVDFPPEWSDPGDREEAWEVVQTNLKELTKKLDLRRQVLENGSRIDGPFFRGARSVNQALRFDYVVTNTDNGHNLPSGSLGAQPEIWLNVALIDPDGKNVWESGYLDRNGDFADLHSLDVRAGKLAHDDQLFNLQSKFLTTNVKGTDREMYLPVNFDVDQIPFLRPANLPASVLNHPPFVRMEQRSLPPLGNRKASYSVPAELMRKPGKYRLAVRLRSRAEPIYFMKFVGATKEMEQAMNRWMVDVHPYTVEFEVK